jgi:excisionase family DNA binding protein
MDTAIDTGPAAGNERLVYPVAEAGALLGISRAFACELVARDELPVIRLGRRRLVPKAALIVAPSGTFGASDAVLPARNIGGRPSVGSAGPRPYAADPVDGIVDDVSGLRLVRVLGIVSDIGLGEARQQWRG